MSVSILVLTLNEEKNLSGCLDSVSWSDDLVVLDSGSTDKTLEIADKLGAKVIERQFDNYAAQRNFGLSFNFKYEWILMLDADERITPEVREEIYQIVKQRKNPVTLYRIRRKDMFMGKWLRRSSGYPTWFGRLFRKGRVRVEREINEEYYTDGKVGLLKGHLIHYPFNNGVAYWFERHNRYSSMEAKRLIAERTGKIVWSNFFNSDPMLRRKTFKKLAYRMPFRPILTFSFLYFWRLGLLDGKAGLHFCLMRSIYEYMINLKIKESLGSGASNASIKRK